MSTTSKQLFFSLLLISILLLLAAMGSACVDCISPSPVPCSTISTERTAFVYQQENPVSFTTIPDSSLSKAGGVTPGYFWYGQRTSPDAQHTILTAVPQVNAATNVCLASNALQIWDNNKGTWSVEYGTYLYVPEEKTYAFSLAMTLKADGANCFDDAAKTDRHEDAWTDGGYSLRVYDVNSDGTLGSQVHSSFAFGTYCADKAGGLSYTQYFTLDSTTLKPGLYFVSEQGSVRADNAAGNDEDYAKFMLMINGDYYWKTLTTTEVQTTYGASYDLDTALCAFTSYAYNSGVPANPCCGDDGNADLNYQSGPFTCTESNGVWKWGGVEELCAAVSGDYNDALNTAPAANDGADGCCGDDTNCVISGTVSCADYSGSQTACASAGCEWTAGDQMCLGTATRYCSDFADANGVCVSAPSTCQTFIGGIPLATSGYSESDCLYGVETCYCGGPPTQVDCTSFTYANCPDYCTKGTAPGTCSGVARSNVCAGLSDTDCINSPLCNLDTTTTSGTDNAYVNTDKQFLCNKDANGDAVVYDNLGTWKWWNATDMYTMHEYDNEFYISNGGSWYTCNASNDATNVAPGDYLPYFDPRWVALNISTDPDEGLCANIPPNLKLLTDKTSADENPFNYLIAQQSDGCTFDSTTNSYDSNKDRTGCCYSLSGNTHNYNASFFLENDCSNIVCFYDGSSVDDLYAVPQSNPPPITTTYPGKYTLTYTDPVLNGDCEDVARHYGGIGETCSDTQYCAGDGSSTLLDSKCCLNGVCVENKVTDGTTAVTGDYECVADLGGVLLPEIDSSAPGYSCSSDLVISKDSNEKALCCLGNDLPPLFSSAFSRVDQLGSRYLCYQHPILQYGSVFGECCGDGVCNNVLTLGENAFGQNNGLVFATGIQAGSVLNFDTIVNGLVFDATYQATMTTDYADKALEVRYYTTPVTWKGKLTFSLRYSGKNIPVALEFYKDGVAEPMSSYLMNESAILPPYDFTDDGQGVLLPNVWHKITLPAIDAVNFNSLKIKFSDTSFTEFASTTLELDDFVLSNNRTATLTSPTYCSELGNWTTTMSEAICGAQLSSAWTGTKCCGASSTQTYVDSALMGCFKGIPVRTNQIAPLAAGGNVEYYPDILYYDSVFYNCTTLPHAQGSSPLLEVGPFSMIGDWYCDATADDLQARWLPLSSIDAEQILASKLYGMRTENAYDLHCDDFSDELSSLNMLATIPGKTYANAKTACVLKNYDAQDVTSDITIGLSLGSGDAVNTVVNTILQGNYPFNGTSMYGDYAVDCSGVASQQIILSYDNHPKFFTNCSVDLSNKQNNNINLVLNVSYSAPLKLLIITMDSPEDVTLLSQFFVRIADFFRGLFQPIGTPGTADGSELSTIPLSFGLAGFGHLYLSERGNLSIVGTMEQTSSNWYARVDYHNLTGNVQPLVDGYKKLLGEAAVTKTTDGTTQTILVTSPTAFDWRYLTSNIRLTPSDNT